MKLMTNVIETRAIFSSRNVAFGGNAFSCAKCNTTAILVVIGGAVSRKEVEKYLSMDIKESSELGRVSHVLLRVYISAAPLFMFVAALYSVRTHFIETGAQFYSLTTTMDCLVECHEVTTYMLNLFCCKLAEVTEGPHPAVNLEKPRVLSSNDEADCHNIVDALVVAFLHPGKIAASRRSI